MMSATEKMMVLSMACLFISARYPCDSDGR